MLIRQIALLSQTQKVSMKELLRVSAALQRQVTRDLAPIWEVKATVDAFDDPQQVPPGYWKITVMDNIPVAARGFHFDEHGHPYADVLWSEDWSLTASHECLEMLVDPFGQQLASGVSVKPGQGRVTYLVEVCDPCEARQFAYTMNTGLNNEEILVSDFYTPSYFDPVAASGVRYSFRGNIQVPRQVLIGGYLSWRDPATGHIWQLFGPAGLGHFADKGVGLLNREQSDRMAGATREKSLKAKLPKRTPTRPIPTMADAAAANDLAQCKLTVDPPTGFLKGHTGDTTTISIHDVTGTAKFVSVSYAGQTIGNPMTDSATFKIVAGVKDVIYSFASLVGTEINVGDPCGGLFDQFTSPGSGTRHLSIQGA